MYKITILVIVALFLTWFVTFVSKIDDSNTAFMEECLQHEKEWLCKALLKLDDSHYLRRTSVRKDAQ